MHELVGLGHSMTHAVVSLCRDETRTSEHIGISPAEEGWTVANDNEMYLVAALTCNVLQHWREIDQCCARVRMHHSVQLAGQASAKKGWRQGAVAKATAGLCRAGGG
jgi:hypothetical protein